MLLGGDKKTNIWTAVLGKGYKSLALGLVFDIKSRNSILRIHIHNKHIHMHINMYTNIYTQRSKNGQSKQKSGKGQV